MQELMNLLNELVEKYQMEEADVARIKEALAKVEGAGDEEFAYEEEE